METEKEFKFKVGDKIKSKGGKDVVEIISLKGENEHNFTGIDLNNNKVDGTYVKYAYWELYKEPKEKIKLQKFYCFNEYDDTYCEINYAKNKKIAEENWEIALTEKEFLEQFEIIE